MLRGLQTGAMCTAAISALTGTGFMAAFLSGSNPQSYVLTAAVIAAIIGLGSLIVGVVIIDMRAGRRFESGTHWAQAGLPGNDSAQCEAARFQKRIQVLDKRLDIDEPRLCSQYLIACTCWSLCGGLPDQDSAAEETTSGLEQRQCGSKSEAKVIPLRVVFRQGRDDCQFRFKSPVGRAMRQAKN